MATVFCFQRAPMESRRSPTHLAPSGLYNILVDSGRQKVVLDVRSQDEYETSFIRSAVLLTSDANSLLENGNTVKTRKLVRILWLLAGDAFEQHRFCQQS
jgi:hypothetical protein